MTKRNGIQELEYPKRQHPHALRFVRGLADCGATELGPVACWLLAVIVNKEDELRYQRAPNFWNPQLLEYTGMASIGQLSLARKIAVKLGCLVYIPGGKARQGT